jgi:hypothetical protein
MFGEKGVLFEINQEYLLTGVCESIPYFILGHNLADEAKVGLLCHINRLAMNGIACKVCLAWCKHRNLITTSVSVND